MRQRSKSQNSRMTVHFTLKSYTAQNIAHALDRLHSLCAPESIQTFRLPTTLRKFTVLSSPHVYKKSREQFEIRTHKARVSTRNCELNQGNTFTNCQYIQLLGVQMQVQLVDTSALY